MLRQIVLKDLVLDYSLYVRDKIIMFHVDELVKALEAGKKLPPIRIDANSKRVVDGFHRTTAYLKLHEPEFEITVDAIEYANEADIFADALLTNVTHGQNLSNYDKANAIIRAEKYNMSIEVLSSLLQMTPERVIEMKKERFAFYEMKPIALKSTVSHLAGTNLDEPQYLYNQHAGGFNQDFYINQVVSMLQSNSMDWGNKRVVIAFQKLRALLKTKAVYKP